jgi:hypothetical protein
MRIAYVLGCGLLAAFARGLGGVDELWVVAFVVTFPFGLAFTFVSMYLTPVLADPLADRIDQDLAMAVYMGSWFALAAWCQLRVVAWVRAKAA